MLSILLNNKFLTQDALEDSSTPTREKFVGFGKVKEECRSKRGGLPPDSSDASKSKSLTHGRNYIELLPESVDPAEPGAFRKLSPFSTGVSLALDAIAPSQSKQKSARGAVDLRGYDVRELKRSHTLTMSAITHAKNMAQSAPIASVDTPEMFRYAP